MNRGLKPVILNSRLIIGILATAMLTAFPALASAKASAAPTDARLTEAHGAVYKRTFTDWTREALGDPQTAVVGDVLHEGMQVGTGDRSWAQLSWQHLNARAWANSVYAISPNRRLVYLVGGELLYQLDKNRKDKSAYFVWTNLLQARIRGTTVLFQATKTTSRITVLEGTVEVLNKVDRSVVTLKPGVVYEISAKPQAGAPDKVSSSSPDAPTPVLTTISQAASPVVPVFETAKTIASVASIDPLAVMNHPLIRNFETPLPSLPLVRDAMTNVQALLETATAPILDTTAKLLRDNFAVQIVPRALSYTLGSEVANIATFSPGAFDYFAPTGNIPQASPLISSRLPVGSVTPTANVSQITGAISGAMPTINFSGATSAMPSLNGVNTVTSTSSILTSAVNSTGAAGGGGVTSGVIGGATGTIGGVGNTVGGVVNGVTGTAGSLTGSLLGF